MIYRSKTVQVHKGRMVLKKWVTMEREGQLGEPINAQLVWAYAQCVPSCSFAKLSSHMSRWMLLDSLPTNCYMWRYKGTLCAYGTLFDFRAGGRIQGFTCAKCALHHDLCHPSRSQRSFWTLQEQHNADCYIISAPHFFLCLEISYIIPWWTLSICRCFLL